nr:MAG TPA: portal protein [Caudoviricetes sp.]
MNFGTIWKWILGLFGIGRSETSSAQQDMNARNITEYCDVRRINFTAIFANTLSALATEESTLGVDGKNKRAELLDGAVQNVWGKIKKIVSMALGTGGCLIVPYVQDGKILFDMVTQDRLLINATRGDKIVNATVCADTVTIDSITYCRFVNYTIENNTLVMTNRVTTQYGQAAELEQWKDIPDISIANVDRVPFGFIKCPIDNRQCSDDYGVPITYGCGQIIKDIYTCMEQINAEFELKRVRLQIDERAFDKDENGRPIIKSDLFMAAHGNSDREIFNVFDCAYRDSSLYNHLSHLYEQLEKAIGTSKGILTDPGTYGATATEIKAGMYGTYTIISDIRKNITKAIEDFLYACDVLANYYNLSPVGEYIPVFDWSYSMIESSAENWQQLKDGQAMGTISKAEVRSWQTGETLEDAQKKVDEIRENEPNLAALMGMGE